MKFGIVEQVHAGPPLYRRLYTQYLTITVMSSY